MCVYYCPHLFPSALLFLSTLDSQPRKHFLNEPSVSSALGILYHCTADNGEPRTVKFPPNRITASVVGINRDDISGYKPTTPANIRVVVGRGKPFPFSALGRPSLDLPAAPFPNISNGFLTSQPWRYHIHLYRAFPGDPLLRANVSTLQLYIPSLLLAFPFLSHCDQHTYSDDLHCPAVSFGYSISFF